MMKLLFGHLFILTSLLAVIAPAHPDDWAGKLETIDGIVHVWNPAEPSEDERILKPERLWAISEESDEDDVLIGAITHTLIDTSGNTYFLDSHISQVIVYDSEGQFLRTIGRSGEGPGEFGTPITMCFLPGDQLGVVQLMPARIVVFTLHGEPQSDFPSLAGDGFDSIQDMQGQGETLVVALQSPSFDSGKVILTGQLVCVDKNGDSTSTLWQKSFEQNMANIVIGSESNTVLPVWDVGRGAVYISPSYDDYRIEVMDFDGKTLRIIEREYESRKRTDEELARQKKLLEKMPIQAGNIEIKLDKTDRDITEMLVRDNGELWVISSHSKDKQKEGILGPFDVFDHEGRYIRDVSIEVDYESKKDTWFLQQDRLYVIKRGAGAIKNAFASIAGIAGISLDDTDESDEEDLLPPEIICYKIGYATD